MEKHILNYWWYQNKQNRTNGKKQVLPTEDLRKLEDYTYSYFSNANFLNIKDHVDFGQNKYPIRLDKEDDFKYFSTLLAEPKIYDRGMDELKNKNDKSIEDFINGAASWYPEKAARYYSSDGTYQYVLLDYEDDGKVKIKLVPDKFIPSSYSAFRPVFVKEQVSNVVSENSLFGDEYKFITEDGLYLLDQSKINSIKDVMEVLSVNPLYLDQINPYFFEKKHDPESSEVDNIELMKKVIVDFLEEEQNVSKLAFFAKPVFGYGLNEEDVYIYGHKIESDITVDEIKKKVVERVVKQINDIFKEKQEQRKELIEYANYRIDKGEEEYINLGLIPNLEGIKQRFYPVMKGYDKNKTFLQRRFDRLKFLQERCEEIEKYRDEVLSKQKVVPEYNDYVNNGKERSEAIKHNEIISRYVKELLDSGFRYKGKTTGIISALNNEYNEHDEKISTYFTLPSQRVIEEINIFSYQNNESMYDMAVLYAPSDEATQLSYEAKPIVCLVERGKRKADVNKFREVYMINGNASERSYIKKINELINEGIVIPLAKPSSNFKNCPAKINFRKPISIVKHSYFDVESGENKTLEINTFSFKKNDPTCKKFNGLLESMIELVNENVVKVDKIKVSKDDDNDLE